MILPRKLDFILSRTVYNNIDGPLLGSMLGCFGQVYMIEGNSDYEY